MATDRRGLVAVFLLALTSVLAFQGSRGLRETTEGRYAEVAREMLETGNFLEPSLDYEPHWSKPPLTYWAVAAGVHVFGRNAWGARFYNIVAFVVTVLAVAACGNALWDRRTGAAAGLVYLSSFLPAVGASVVSADGLLVMWETLAVLFYIEAYRCREDARSRWWIRAMWLAFGLAFFTKGPPALLPLLALGVFHLRSRRSRVLADPAGILVFFVTAFWWFAVVLARHPELLGYFVGKEVVARNLSTEFSRNAQWYGPLTIYAPVLLVGQGAWLYYGFCMFRQRALYKPARIVELFGARGSPRLLLFLWFLVPLVIFSLSRSRLQLYILPLFAPIALATGRFILHSQGEATGFRRTLRVALISVLVIVCVKALGPHVSVRRDMARLYHRATAAARGEAAYVLFRERELYGFQFYAGGNVQRVSVSGREPWADKTLGATVDEIVNKPLSQAYVIISGQQSAVVVRRELYEAHVTWTETEESRWKLFVIGACRD